MLPPASIAWTPGDGGYMTRPSWFFRVLPFMEGANAYEAAETDGSSFAMTGLHGANRNWELLSALRQPALVCPSSSMPEVVPVATNAATQALGAPESVPMQAAHYVGIGGSAYRPEYDAGSGFYATAWPTRSRARDSYSGYGFNTENGLLDGACGPAENSLGYTTAGLRACRIADVTDGMSNTFLVGEQSDYVWSADLTTGVGVDASGTPRAPKLDGRSTITDGVWADGEGGSAGEITGVTSIGHAINPTQEEIEGHPMFRIQYVDRPWQRHTPITSAHAGGALFVRGDGSVVFVSEMVDLGVLFAMGNRADGSLKHLSD